jgi:predicted Zn-dependent protease
MNIRALGRAGLAVVLAGSLAACTTNMATGQKFFTTLSPEQEAQIGEEASPEMIAEFGGKTPSPELQAYITEVGMKLAAQVEDPQFKQLKWEYTLLDSPVVNAFALPGGKVFITRGLADKLTSEAQLAGVLGHETGHVSAQHTARRIGQATLLNAGLAAAGLAVGASGNEAAQKYGQYALPALAVGGNLYLLKFGRDEESQADYLGMRYMAKAGWNPRAQEQVMEVLKSQEGGSSPPEFLSTHPIPATRIDDINSLLKTKEFAGAGNLPFNESQYQQRYLRVARTLPPPKQPAPATEGQAQEKAKQMNRQRQQGQQGSGQPAQGMQAQNRPPSRGSASGNDVVGHPK